MTECRLIVDVAGPVLTAEDKDVLKHPAIAGVILFSRNYVDPAQLEDLTAQIHALCRPAMQISIDQEGGRVCRIREPLPRLPSAREVAAVYVADPARGLALAATLGWIIGAALRAFGIDMSFTPVLDLDYGVSAVIGDRSLGRDPAVVAALAGALLEGLDQVAMPAVGKHFPGHGAVVADSHLELPVDTRSLAELEGADLIPFCALFARGLDAIMTAHVTYPQVDSLPVTFSHVWLQQILRQRLGFSGFVFSDDLSMHATAGFGDMWARYQQAAEVGCDRILICNDRSGAVSVLDRLTARRATHSGCTTHSRSATHSRCPPRLGGAPTSFASGPAVQARFEGQNHSAGGWKALASEPVWRDTVASMQELLKGIS